MRPLYLVALLTVCIFSCFSQVALAIERPQEELQEVGVSQHLGDKVNLDVVLTDHTGKTQALRDFLAPNRPTILVPVYYECPRLCGLILNGLVKVVNELPLKFGTDYQIAIVSFDSSETPKMATRRRETFLNQIFYDESREKSLVEQHLHFFVGQEPQVASLMQEIGFKAKKDHKDFAHGAALILLTPQGQISQYLMGISFVAFDLKLSLVEASQGSIGSLVDHIMLFCFRYDQLQGKYIWVAFDAFWWGGVLTLIGLGSLMFWLFSGEKNRKEGNLSDPFL